jgi:hypothetical protein
LSAPNIIQFLAQTNTAVYLYVGSKKQENRHKNKGG